MRAARDSGLGHLAGRMERKNLTEHRPVNELLTSAMCQLLRRKIEHGMQPPRKNNNNSRECVAEKQRVYRRRVPIKDALRTQTGFIMTYEHRRGRSTTTQHDQTPQVDDRLGML
jgi:hypothetical protein